MKAKTKKLKQASPSLGMRLNDEDLSKLRDLAQSLNRSQTDVVRILIREAKKVLPDLVVLAQTHPILRAAVQK